jgi:small subunit ribosomal protein S20
MAYHKQAKKRIRQTLRRNQVNRARVSRVRTYIKYVEAAIANADRKSVV